MSDINQKLLKISEKLLNQEIKKTGLPPIENHKVCLLYGERLSKAYKVNKDFISACLNFMDVKIGEAYLKKKLPKHMEMSLEATLKAIKSLKLNPKMINKISDCVLSHHGVKKYPSIEAEICANADCFKFLHPRGVFAFLVSLGKRGIALNEALNYAEQKMNEKIAIISLPEVKKEAKDYYQALMKLVRRANR